MLPRSPSAKPPTHQPHLPFIPPYEARSAIPIQQVGEVTPREVNGCAWEHSAVAQLDVNPGRPHSPPWCLNPKQQNFLWSSPPCPTAPANPLLRKFPSFSSLWTNRVQRQSWMQEFVPVKPWASHGPLPEPANPPRVPSPVPAPLHFTASPLILFLPFSHTPCRCCWADSAQERPVSQSSPCTRNTDDHHLEIIPGTT